jgi:hypothetical protein
MAAVASPRIDANAPWLVVLDATALVPIFVTGIRGQLPPRADDGAAKWMKAAFLRLRRRASICVAPWARLAEAYPACLGPASLTGGSRAADWSAAIDELRLLVLPRVAMPGVIGIEVGLAWSSTPTGWTATPEVLARVLDGSPAEAKLAREVPGIRLVSGRRLDERVAPLSPIAPTRAGALALATAVAAALSDRRAAVPRTPWTAVERRGVFPKLKKAA